MTLMTARDFDKELLELYGFHAHGLITKREFLDRTARFAVGGLTVMTIPGMMSPDYEEPDHRVLQGKAGLTLTPWSGAKVKRHFA